MILRGVGRVRIVSCAASSFIEIALLYQLGGSLNPFNQFTVNSNDRNMHFLVERLTNIIHLLH